jgi:tryptophan-rich sensory protein
VSLIAVRDFRALGVATAAAFSLGTAGALITDLSSWYFGLRKPSWQPPDWLFGPAWTLIFTLAAVAGYRAWTAGHGQPGRIRILPFFAANGLLNMAWSWLFFAIKRPDWALYEVGFLWLSIVALIFVLAPFSRLAGWLLVPYLAWVSFASILNRAIVELNRPFT